MTEGGAAPRLKNDYGLPMACPKCAYRWLKLPGLKMQRCPNDDSELRSMRKKKTHQNVLA